jgi:hypothetical protein
MEQFVTDLRIRARECKLGDLQDELIKTMLIMGIRDESVPAKLTEKDGTSLTLDKVVECCILTENSRKQLHEMKNGETPNRLNLKMVNRHQTTKPSTSSHGQQPGKMINNSSRCGQNHKINNCAAMEKFATYRCPRVAKKLHNLFVIKDIKFFFFLDDSYASTAYSENIAVYIQVSQYYKNTKVMFF